MAATSKADIVRRYFAAYKKDRKAVEELLADDFTFTSPYDDAIDKATYFKKCWPDSGRMKTPLRGGDPGRLEGDRPARRWGRA